MYQRILDLTKLLKKKSSFSVWPQRDGKTTLVKHTLTDATVIGLLEIRTYREYLKSPSILSEQNTKPLVVISEEI